MELIKYSIIKAGSPYDVPSRNYLLFFQIDGNSVLKDSEKEKAFPKGRIRVFNPRESYFLKCLEGVCVVLEISYSRVLKLMGYQRKIIICDVDSDSNDSSMELKKNIEELIRAYYDDSVSRMIIYERCCLQLIFQLVSSYSNNVFSNGDDERKNGIEDYIEAHYADEISLEEIADEFYLTPQYFSKYFKETFGTTFLSYVNHKRLEYARDDLLSSDESALRIAVNNGFANSASFIREFKKEYDMTPAQYRAKNRRTDIEESDQDILEYLEENKEEATGNEKIIDIDGNTFGSELNRYWTNILNLQSFRTLMKNGMMEQITELQSRLHFSQARLQLDTYSPDGKHLFYISDRVMELFVRNHMDVIVVIDMRDITDSESYLSFLKEQCQKFVNRFGGSISRHIVFELQYNSSFTDKKLKDYRKLYDSISKVIKENRIESKIIGPSVLVDHEGENFRSFVRANPQIDTFTISVAPFAIYQKDGEIFINRLTDSSFGKEQYETAVRILKEENRDAKVLITEWKDSLNEADALNETAYMGSRIIRNVLSGYGTFTSLPLCMPLDLMYDEMAYGKVFNLLPGIMTAKGIEKPSFHALVFLNRQDTYLVSNSEDYLISRSSDDGFYQILCHNCKKLGYRYFLQENYEDVSNYHEMFEDNETKVFRFCFKNIPNGKYLLKVRRVSDDYGCAYMAYENLKYNDDSFVGEGEIRFLKAASVPKMEGTTYRVDHNELQIECALESNEFCHLHLVRVLD